MYLPNLAGLMALLFSTAFLLILVPRERIPVLLPAALLFTVIMSPLTYYGMQYLWEAWRFQNVDFLTVAGLPLLLMIAWVPYMTIFFHLQQQYRSPVLLGFMILVAAAVPAFFHFLLSLNGMITAQRWPWWGNFLYAAAIYTVTTFIYQHFLLAGKQKLRP